MKTFTLMLALAAALAAPGSRAQAQDTETQRALDAIAFFDKHEKSQKDLHKFGDLLAELGDTQHPLAAARVGEVLEKARDVDRQMMAADVLAEFRKTPQAREAAAAQLLAALDRDGYEFPAMDSIINSIGLLEYRPAVDPLLAFMKKHRDPWLLLAVVRAFGRIGDRKVLPVLLAMWDEKGQGYGWDGVSVTVDTGTAGDADQRAAEAQGQAQSGMMGKGRASSLYKVFIQELMRTVQKLTGDKDIDEADKLYDWMVAHRAELEAEGVEIPERKETKKKDKEKEK